MSFLVLDHFGMRVDVRVKGVFALKKSLSRDKIFVVFSVENGGMSWQSVTRNYSIC